jgi:hypothetical protein
MSDDGHDWHSVFANLKVLLVACEQDDPASQGFLKRKSMVPPSGAPAFRASERPPRRTATR